MEKKNERLVFIDGHFDSREAKEIITNVFSAKIMFHEMRNFSAMERYGKPDESALRRIPELRKALAAALQIINAAKAAHLPLAIHSVIDISIGENWNNK